MGRRPEYSWKNREVGVNNQVGLVVAGNAMVCAKKTAVGEMETKKWFSESLLVAACFCLLMYVIIKMESTKSKVCFMHTGSIAYISFLHYKV